MIGPRIIAIAAFVLAASAGAALAQLSDPDKGFYANPVFPDPVMPKHVVAPAAATTDEAVAATAAAKRPQRPAPCNALNPCATVTPAHG